MMKLRETGLLISVMSMMLLSLTGCGSSARPYDLDLSQYVKVGNYRGLTYTDFEIDVSDKEIENELEEEMQNYSIRTELTEGTVENGDYVSILYKLEVNDRKIDGTSSQNYMFQVGAENILEDIDEALVGRKLGETFEVETTFPEDFELNAGLAGKKALFSITVSKLYDVAVPELDDEFVSENLGFDTVESYMEDLEKTLYEEKLKTARYSAGEEIWAQVLENSEVIRYPEKEVEEKQEALTENFKILCSQYGITFEDALDSVLQIDEETFNRQMKDCEESAVKEEMILFSIARENGLEMTAQEQQDYLTEVLKENQLTAKEFKEKYSTTIQKYAEENDFFQAVIYERVLDFLVDEGKAG